MLISASTHKIKKSDQYDQDNISKIDNAVKRIAAVIIELKSLRNIISLNEQEDIQLYEFINQFLDNWDIQKNVINNVERDFSINCDPNHLSLLLKEIVQNANEKESCNQITLASSIDGQDKFIIILKLSINHRLKFTRSLLILINP